MKNWINTKISETREVWSMKMYLEIAVGIMAACLIIIVVGTGMTGVTPKEQIPPSETIARIEAVSADPALGSVVFDSPNMIDLTRNTVVIYAKHKLFPASVEDTPALTVTFTLKDGGEYVVIFGDETVSLNGSVKALKDEPGKSVEILNRKLFS